MTTAAKLASGTASPKLNPAKIRKLSQPTAPKPATESEYEKARVAELENRAALYRQKFERMQAQLLDRALLRGELEVMFAAVRKIINGTPGLTKREKRDCERNLPDVDELLKRIAMQQNIHDRSPNGNGDHHPWDEVLN